ncbi:hypothetical protein FA950_29280 [Bacillus thuringiensis]|uniref:hypothetical protein n=1 Tax=Bacillus thuringiensis TaxID=1428 RepID=UPI0010AC0CDC|nr:hypothetical protein [Bacillus thuringiensis]TJZ99974.1 hypothetical protein FA950_29280 [Bacillus thuringiensis]
MKAYKKLATLAPIAVLSTSILCSPAITFAAETTHTTVQHNAFQQDHMIQGYVIKNGVKTPVYKGGIINNQTDQSTDAPYPELSSNPNDPIPMKGSVHSEDGKIGSIIYFKQVTSTTAMGIQVEHENVYAQKNEDGTITWGDYDPQTLKRSSSSDNDVQSMFSKINIPAEAFFNTTITRNSYYTKLGSGVQPKNSKYSFSQAITSGLTTTNAVGGALTLGYKLTLTEGGGILPASATQEFSAQLSATYNHTVAVTSQVTQTQTQEIPHASDSYKQDKYAAAVYQLHSDYTVKPSPELQQAISNGTVTVDGANTFSYDDSTLYLAVTPGAGV